MSTTYATLIQPHEFGYVTRVEGWYPLPTTEGNAYTDGTNYLWASYDGGTLIMTRYAGNNDWSLVDALAMVQEGDEEFDEIMGYDDPEDE